MLDNKFNYRWGVWGGCFFSYITRRKKLLRKDSQYFKQRSYASKSSTEREPCIWDR